MRRLHDLGTQFGAQRGHLFGWKPVLLGLGICGYFAAQSEPAAITCVMLLEVGLFGIAVQRRLPDGCLLDPSDAAEEEDSVSSSGPCDTK